MSKVFKRFYILSLNSLGSTLVPNWEDLPSFGRAYPAIGPDMICSEDIMLRNFPPMGEPWGLNWVLSLVLLWDMYCETQFETVGCTFLDILFQWDDLLMLSCLSRNSLKLAAVVFGRSLASISSNLTASSFIPSCSFFRAFCISGRPRSFLI